MVKIFRATSGGIVFLSDADKKREKDSEGEEKGGVLVNHLETISYIPPPPLPAFPMMDSLVGPG